MGRLRWPLVPDGPIRVFYERLHAAHHAAGWPSIRQLQRATRGERWPNGINPTTIHEAFVLPRLARWEVVEEIVQRLGGDVTEFADLWRRARAAEVGDTGGAVTDAPDPQGPERTSSGMPLPRELPPDPADFIGRAGQVAQLDQLLADRTTGVAIVAITGTAGVGKTALAVHWAHRVRHRFPEGQLFVDLRGYGPGDPVRPIEALAWFLRALGVPDDQIPAEVEPATARYRSLLTDRRALVLVDNAADVEQIRPLLPGSPSCMVVTTSRDRLTGLVAREGARRVTLDVLGPDEAAALLARALGPDRAAGERDAIADLANACARLPLAMRVAAANLINTPGARIADYAARLRGEDGLAALDADGDPQSAVRGAFDLSYRELAPDAARLFRLLGLAPGPDITADAAAALAGTTVRHAASQLDQLAAAHLVDQPVPGRYACHDLLRQYAADRARAEEAESDLALQGLTARYLQRVDAAARVLYPHRLRLPVPAMDTSEPASFEDNAAALRWLDAERGNLLASIRYAADNGHRSMAWRLADALRGYLWLRMLIVDWTHATTTALAAAEAEGDVRAQAVILQSIGDLHHRQVRHERAIEYYQRALALSERAGWVEARAGALLMLGAASTDLGDLSNAVEYHVKGLSLCHSNGLHYPEAVGRCMLGILYRDMGRLDEAVECFDRALTLHRQLGSRHGEAIVLYDLAESYRLAGRLDDAVDHFQRARHLCREVGDRSAETYTARGLAAAHSEAGRSAEALELANEALMAAHEVNDRRAEAEALNTIADIHYRLDGYREATEYHRQALSVARATDDRPREVEACVGLADALRGLGDLVSARENGEHALALARRLGLRLLADRAAAALDRIPA